jgi:hypothetical protein
VSRGHWKVGDGRWGITLPPNGIGTLTRQLNHGEHGEHWAIFPRAPRVPPWFNSLLVHWWVRLPPNGIGTLTLPATRNGGLAGRVFTIKAYKNSGFRFLDPPPRHLAKGSGGPVNPGQPRSRKWVALRPRHTHGLFAYAGSIIRCPVGQAVGQRLGTQKCHEYRHFLPLVASVVPLSIVWGGRGIGPVSTAPPLKHLSCGWICRNSLVYCGLHRRFSSTAPQLIL